jgi:hypothetical protein
LGYVGSRLQEEEVMLNGNTPVSTTRLFTTLVKISKSDKTHGFVTASSNTGGVTNVILEPGETDIDIQFVNFYPVPAKTETLNYDAYIRHPHLYKESDSPLFPTQFHSLLVLDLFIKLMTEFKGMEVSQLVLARRDAILQRMIEIDNSTDNWHVLQETDEATALRSLDNLPGMYGSNDDF